MRELRAPGPMVMPGEFEPGVAGGERPAIRALRAGEPDELGLLPELLGLLLTVLGRATAARVVRGS